ncbi:MAG: methylmalonyl Co-A mutase-associated GTPase MeaB [Bryobacteraceae bacterium]
MRSELTPRVLAGDLRALSRAATLIENRAEGARGLAADLAPHAGRARVIGVTGPPGVGKSTLADRITAELRSRGLRVAIVAVDPTSPVSGGAILGDRIRMQSHHSDAGVFIRSMASRGALGGLADATRDMITLLDAAGWDVVIVETVGVGQAEVEVARHTGTVAVVLVPGLGDDVQALKAGILEVADLFVINKADHEGADRLEREIHGVSDKQILKTVASEGRGVAEVVDALLALTPRVRDAGAVDGIAIDHLGIAVRSVDAALAFYRGLLGMALAGRETVQHEHVHVAMLAARESRLELLEATEGGTTISKFIEKRGEGIHHVALRVRDFDGTIERLRAAGARLLDEPRRGAGGHEYVFVHPASAGGVLMELIREERTT